tara:strand:- start:124 stop:495 length:372 start_codon:yes stop_codon:yes gene_type:complete
MLKTIIKQFPKSDVVLIPKSDDGFRKYTHYTKEQVDILIAAAVKEAVDEARKIDEASMAKHNRDATVISMILGFTTLALFVDGLLRLLGIIPPFMDVDVNILEKIVERVESDITPILQRIPKI